MEFGLILSQFTDRWDHLIGDARRAEAAGLDSVWLVDHLLGMPAENPVFEGWTGLAVVAGAVDRVRLGHLVTCVGFRNPGLLAKMAATLDHASSGRLELGLGAGWYQAEYEAFGFAYGTAGDRRRHFTAYVEALVALLAGEKVDYDGPGVSLRGAMISPGPLQPRVPIVVGAGRRMMLEVTGRLADTWNCPARLIPTLEGPQAMVHAAAAGRPVRTTIQVPVVVGRTQEEADAALAASGPLAWMGDVAEIGLGGTVEQAVEKVVAYRERGVDGFIAQLPGTRRRPDFIAAYGELADACRTR
jgi:alkanesulfonate monooxygenase SsuD/methylene tetrahydromethanopterin reductase-like flavin-dependent oxidoreductase (luciferase family)